MEGRKKEIAKSMDKKLNWEKFQVIDLNFIVMLV